MSPRIFVSAFGFCPEWWVFRKLTLGVEMPIVIGLLSEQRQKNIF